MALSITINSACIHRMSSSNDIWICSKIWSESLITGLDVGGTQVCVFLSDTVWCSLSVCVYVIVLYVQQYDSQSKSVPQQIPQKNYLQPSSSVYKGRSLPNVNQITSGSIDLQVMSSLAQFNSCITTANGYSRSCSAVSCTVTVKVELDWRYW